MNKNKFNDLLNAQEKYTEYTDISRCNIEVYVNNKLLIKEHFETREDRNIRMRNLVKILAGTKAYIELRYKVLRLKNN